MTIDATTEFVGVIGDPVRHSLSPVIHNAAYDALGLNWRCGAFEVRGLDVPAAIDGARALGFRGLAVTMPHKQAAARAVEQMSEVAERLGALNTITFRGGVAVGDSTDGEGLIEDLATGADFDPRGQICAVIGAGGAARAAVVALESAGAKEILIVNRTPQHATAAASLVAGVARPANVEDLSSAALVVNATPIGMHGTLAVGPETTEGPALDFDAIVSALGPQQLVIDLVYAPPTTDLLQAAAARGARTRNGLGVLIAQAARQIERWSGLTAPREVMAEAAVRALGDEHH